MYTQWVTNAHNSMAFSLRDGLESTSGNVCFIGRPRPNREKVWSVIELEAMNLVGIYMEVLDDQQKAGPKCPECKGTGIIILFTSSSPCGCLKRGVVLGDDLHNHND